MQEGGGDLRRQEGEGTWWGLRERGRRKEHTLQKRLARSAKADGEEERRLLLDPVLLLRAMADARRVETPISQARP